MNSTTASSTSRTCGPIPGCLRRNSERVTNQLWKKKKGPDKSITERTQIIDIGRDEKDPARHSKLEKADILEMTVKHLQTVQRQQMSTAVAADPSVLQKFQTGFSECASEVSRYIGKLDGVEQGVKQRLLAHLSGCVSGLNQIAPLASSALAGGAQGSAQDDVNNNTSRVQLGRLTSSQLALVLPPGHPHPPLSPAGSSSSSSSAYSEHALENAAPEVTSTTPSVPEDPPPPALQPLHRPLTVVPPPLDYSLKRGSSCLRQDDDQSDGEGRLLLMKCPRLYSAFTLVGSTSAPSTSAHSPQPPPPPPSEPATAASDVWRPW